MRVLGVAALLSATAGVGEAFMAPRHTVRAPTRLAMARGTGAEAGPQGNSRMPEEAMVKDLLTLRAAQSMNYYSLEFHDTTSVQWVEKFMNETDITEFGSTQFLYRLMRTDPEEITIKKMRQMPRGGSGNNPYLKDKGVAIEYNVLIDPMGIARKLMSVRKQIADEWAEDLTRIEADNREVQRFRESAARVGLAASARIAVFDSESPMMSSSSPYRTKNFLDLKRVITAEALTASLNYLRDQRQTSLSEWLLRFAQENKEVRGTDFIEALHAADVVLLPSKGDKIRAIEPYKLAALIMKYRAEIATEWIAHMQQVGTDHTKLHAMMLEFQFRSGSEDVAAALSEQLREEYKRTRDKQRESLLSGAAAWWEEIEDLEEEY